MNLRIDYLALRYQYYYQNRFPDLLWQKAERQKGRREVKGEEVVSLSTFWASLLLLLLKANDPVRTMSCLHTEGSHRMEMFFFPIFGMLHRI